MTPTPVSSSRSMVRELRLADWFTLANAACGAGAMFAMMSYIATLATRHIFYATGLVLAALIFDVLDGRVARWQRRVSPIGQELDSLADIISFGATPALIAYGCGMHGAYDRVVLIAFICCGVARLARYNVTADAMSAGTGKVTHFEGTPIPTSIVLVIILACAAWTGAVGAQLWLGELPLPGGILHPLVLMYAVSGALMISRFNIPKP